MTEQDNGPRTAEEVLSLLKQVVKPVISGDQQQIILGEINVMSQGIGVRLRMVPGIGSQIAEEARKQLFEYLGVDDTKPGDFISDDPEFGAPPQWTSITHYPTKIGKHVVVEAEDTRPYQDSGGYLTRTWRIKNLKPKSRIRKAKDRVRRRLSRWQYAQG
jgi:hypothetical protein